MEVKLILKHDAECVPMRWSHHIFLQRFMFWVPLVLLLLCHCLRPSVIRLVTLPVRQDLIGYQGFPIETFSPFGFMFEMVYPFCLGYPNSITYSLAILKRARIYSFGSPLEVYIPDGKIIFQFSIVTSWFLFLNSKIYCCWFQNCLTVVANDFLYINIERRWSNECKFWHVTMYGAACSNHWGDHGSTHRKILVTSLKKTRPDHELTSKERPRRSVNVEYYSRCITEQNSWTELSDFVPKPIWPISVRQFRSQQPQFFEFRK